MSDKPEVPYGKIVVPNSRSKDPGNNNEASIYYNMSRDSLCFHYGGNNLVEFRDNGDILIRGSKVSSDKAIVYGLREWSKIAGIYPLDDGKG